MSKVDEFSTELQNLSFTAKGLSHPARIAIIRFIANEETCIPIELTQELPLSRGTVKQHLDELKSRGWIKTTLVNDKAVICLNKEKLKTELSQLTDQLAIEINQARC